MWKVIRFLYCKLQAEALLALHVYGRQYLHWAHKHTQLTSSSQHSLLHTTAAIYLYGLAWSCGSMRNSDDANIRSSIKKFIVQIHILYPQIYSLVSGILRNFVLKVWGLCNIQTHVSDMNENRAYFSFWYPNSETDYFCHENSGVTGE